MYDTFALLRATSVPPLHRRGLATLQVNPGYRCNRTCSHYHVNFSLGRTEQMGLEAAYRRTSSERAA